MTDFLAIEAAADDLFEAANRVNQIVPTKSTKPALESLLFQVHEGCLEISGSNLQVSIMSRVPNAKVVTLGTMLLNGARFVDLLKKFKGAQVKITAGARGHCTFSAPNAEFKLVGDDPRDFPPLPRYDATPGFTIRGSELCDMFAKTEFAVSADQIRGMNTQGVAIELAAGYIRMVGTDTSRLSIAERPAVADATLLFTSILPISFVRVLMKAVPRDTKEAQPQVVIGSTSSQVFVRTDRFTISSVSILGNYPPYQSALDMSLLHHVDLSMADFRRLLQRAVFVNEAQAAFHFTPGKLSLKSKSRDVGVGDVSTDVDYAGDPVTIGFNPRFIDDALGVLKGDKCRFRFEHDRKACLVREITTDAGGTVVESTTFRYMVMPMMLEGPREERDE